ncbi:protein-methionine-sulfoxide reductase heme-binding subunit MsrQ [Sedimentitalea sp. CY04]|uniref:Protein-methionine-sulfoxide reductase heme-binding subunit MsrQ n=1 Tax=Parasedimentitalea denitrificans TaxID=2211118 RepID=A0ABX0W8K8_9RHOB|nr:protein-methionine-sulfoxide reductase heme-binding subunit MsrQ [Sedimentitalea sp. CY04]NIZ61979.1 protein-methionine-sulfoxide reductase heme-binding subunit MsrQ [Sedimentitalea sp. CY04]
MRDRLNQTLRRVPTWVIYMLGMLPAPWFFYQGLTGALGVEPIKALEHKYGELALQLLVVSLAITPMRTHLGINLLKFRRAVGLLCFFYVSCHLLVWLVLDVQLLDQIVADIIKRPYITIGMAGFVLMLPLALTSNNWSIRRLGPMWRKLHKATYVIGLLGAVHFVMLVKGVQLEPLIYLAVIIGLLALRLPGRRSSTTTPVRRQRA